MTGHAQITQNNKFAKSLGYLRKEMGVEVEFLCRSASKFSLNRCYHFWWAWPGMPKVLKITSMQNICKQELSYEVDVLHADNYESLLQVDIIILMKLARHVQSTRASLQYFCDIIRRKWGMKYSWFKHYFYCILYIQCSPTIEFFPLSIWNSYQAFYLTD